MVYIVCPSFRELVVNFIKAYAYLSEHKIQNDECDNVQKEELDVLRDPHTNSLA